VVALVAVVLVVLHHLEELQLQDKVTMAVLLLVIL
jgi:hypothetical protein